MRYTEHQFDAIVANRGLSPNVRLWTHYNTNTKDELVSWTMFYIREMDESCMELWHLKKMDVFVLFINAKTRFENHVLRYKE